jgi:glycerol-3-phosphate responsive antiterminator
MEKVEEKFLEGKKKISLNLDENLLSLVEDMAKLSKTNKTMMIEAFVYRGIANQMRYMEETWIKMKSNPSVDQKKVKQVLQELQEIKKKHKNFLEKMGYN